MSMSTQEPPFGEDVYYYFKKEKRGNKMNKIRVRVSEKVDNHYSIQRVRDGYIWWVRDISNLIKEN